ncbi:unnamed protein product [Effrenium voratum]|nr:unnamed protein product [Effrenium voratum]
MLAKIQSGEFENNFFDGEVLESTPGSEKEATAGCLLDKVGAIVEEKGVQEFVNDLQVDLAACCTKDAADCFVDVEPAYKLLQEVNSGAGDAKHAPKVAAILMKAIEKRVTAGQVKKSHKSYFGKCPDIEQCTLEKFQYPKEL